MNELSLFSGAGGGLLGSLLLGWRPIGYVEKDEHCQRVIRRRIEDGILANAPIFGDIRSFIDQGFAASYQGMVDVLSGGFPCQPFSLAGTRLGKDDARNLWPATIECLRIIRPPFAFLENVPGLLSSGYFGTILGDLAQSGYDARWRILSAAELGAPHKRDRLWIVAHATSGQSVERGGGDLAEAAGGGQGGDTAVGPGGADVADADGGRRQQRLADAQREISELDEVGWWQVEPALGRVVDGYAGRVAELRAAGNAQVPAVAARAWTLLTADL
jgi:DNA (cytosine-5)-methyltransferase 1